jgi:hypothetical protein
VTNPASTGRKESKKAREINVGLPYDGISSSSKKKGGKHQQ